MKIDIKYEDTYSLNELIRWEFMNSHQNVTIEYITEFITERFNKAATYLGVHQNQEFSDSCIEIKIIMGSPSDDGSRAYFDIVNFKEGSKQFNFKLYAEVLLEIIRSENFSVIDTILIHELVHMIDYKEIIKAQHVIKNKYYQERSRDNSAFSVKRYRHLFLLKIITHFRDEGIATLVEFIAGDIDKKLSSTDDALSEFHKIIETTITYIYPNNPDANQKYNYYRKTITRAYNIGAGVVLKCLIKKHSDIPDLNNLENSLNTSKPIKFKLDSCLVDVIKSLTVFDIIQFAFDKEWLYEKIFKITSDYAESLDQVTGFFIMLERIQQQKDRGYFITMMEFLLKNPMSLCMINQAYHDKCNFEGAPDEVINNVDKLYQYLQQNPANEVAIWALSYFYSKHDLISDNIDYFGFIDDHEVLKTALVILMS